MKSDSYSSVIEPVCLSPSRTYRQVIQDPSRVETPQPTKTLADLQKIIPALKELMINADHEIGESYYERGIGIEGDSALNTICYEEAGWDITIMYQCCGEWYDHPGDRWTPPEHSLRKAYGEILSIEASVENEETGEYRIFSDDEVSVIWIPLEECLNECLSEYTFKN